jgi:hypothetical protein
MQGLSKIDGKDKMFAPKINSLWKHARRRKALVRVHRVCDVGEYYMNKDSINAKNERLYVAIKKDSILKQVYHVVIGKRKNKLV